MLFPEMEKKGGGSLDNINMFSDPEEDVMPRVPCVPM
jgi:hypothetical protein